MADMKSMHLVVGLLVLGGVAAAVYWPGGGTSTPTRPGDEQVAPGAGAGTPGTLGKAEDSQTGKVPGQGEARGDQAAGAPREPGAAVRGDYTPRSWSGVVRSVPASARGKSAGNQAVSSGSSGTPRVSARLAFKALLYVGVDPEAEKTWMTAINDPNLPEGVRSDLIEDLNDEGYEDPSGNHITKRDLPLILARMEIIERLAPYAMDKVNADAFQEAYKDLLNMYVRLKSGGP